MGYVEGVDPFEGPNEAYVEWLVRTNGGLESGALSVAAIDPGQVSGWVWACIPFQWLLSGVESDHCVAQASALGWVKHHQLDVFDRPRKKVGIPDHVVEYEGYVAYMLLKYCSMADRFIQRGFGAADVKCRTVIVEDFILREHSSNRNLLSPVRITSMLEYAMWRDRQRTFSLHLQSSSNRSIVRAENLQQAQCWFEGKEHARDAAAHLLLFLRRLRPLLVEYSKTQ